MKNLVNTIKDGGIVAVPTETVYGIACNALNSVAVESIYAIKGRPEVKPLSIMVHDSSWIERFCLDIPSDAYVLADKFWPGPLTIILNSNESIPLIVRAGGKTIGLRCPDNPLTLELIKEADLPLAAPSANPSGLPSARSAHEVFSYFGNSIDILDGGECQLGFASTILDMTKTPYSIIREGAVTISDISDALADKSFILGLTGQTGSGKTTALDILKDKNYFVIDCDEIYHQLLSKNTEMLEDIEFMFPEAFNNGELNRKSLSNIVFNNPDELALLNDLTHGYVVDEVKKQINLSILSGSNKIVIEAIELISSGLSALCDKVIGIVSDKEIRIRRIMDRDSISYDAALSRINAQKDLDYYIENCDLIISNNSDIDSFKRQLLKEV